MTKLTNFGAFARVEGAVEGLIHISELSARMISHPREVVSEGEAVRVKILRIEPERRRLGLSLKQAEDEEGAFAPYQATGSYTAYEGSEAGPAPAEGIETEQAEGTADT